MSLLNITRSQFPQRVRSRGDHYFNDRRVSLEQTEKTFVVATVSGNELYEVCLDFSARGRLEVSCTCPHFDGGQLCKHIWATIRKVDAEGVLSSRNGSRALSVVAVGWADEEEGFSHSAQVKLTGKAVKQPLWKVMLRDVDGETETPKLQRAETAEELVYDIAPDRIRQGAHCLLQVMHRIPKRNGEWGRYKPLRYTEEDMEGRFRPEDQEILTYLHGAEGDRDSSNYGYGSISRAASFSLAPRLMNSLLPRILATGRCRLHSPEEDDWKIISLDEGPPWSFVVNVDEIEGEDVYRVTGTLCRDDEKRELDAGEIISNAGWVFWPDRAARLDHGDAIRWIATLRKYGSIDVPQAEASQLMRRLYAGGAVRTKLPEAMQVKTESVTPQPMLSIAPADMTPRASMVCAGVSFDYGIQAVDAGDPIKGFYDPEKARYVPRHTVREQECMAELQALHCNLAMSHSLAGTAVEFHRSRFSGTVAALLMKGWRVEAEGKRYRGSSQFDVRVSSGLDWFDLEGNCEFDGVKVGLPRLLKAAAEGGGTVELDDGSIGLLPEEWIAKYQTVAGLGESKGDRIRFSQSQGGLLDALMMSMDEMTCDETFARIREELGTFEGVEAVDAPEGFKGVLRGYQREGLGWIGFLQRFKFGGCLADDMGLGKTVQVLALLAERHAQGKGPSLVVVPRSILFNWRRESEAFTPMLRILDYSGTGRRELAPEIPNHDLILTTYGTLRRDIGMLKEIHFDYAILDEAQSVKNASTQASKAVRLLSAEHRLALSGTPVENHLGELWSLFEFLNPGMLGSARLFSALEATMRDPDEKGRLLLARGIRPFILRRTKGQVAKELPDKVEETVYCDLDTKQRKEYDELRDHYRATLLKQVDKDGINRNKMQILEALLRLRQAACHPGLIDGEIEKHQSAKLDVLMSQLGEVIEEKHKVLVFSQFTKFLGIVRQRFDEAGIKYSYLDGRTRKREEKVAEFREDPDCMAFLISLKAGGLGLNLVEAEYVYLLDPWWNPAVEAQAIDRAHRIGQTRTVFAYRLIARNTVEEKILAMQEDKRQLAEAIISADNSLIRTISREDLELLLS